MSVEEVTTLLFELGMQNSSHVSLSAVGLLEKLLVFLEVLLTSIQKKLDYFQTSW